MNYDDTIKLLTSQAKFQIRLGLERIGLLLSLIGNPQEQIKIIHVAGTNGKGSVCAILANILKCSGYKTGLYTSPHLNEYTERIQINNIRISKDEFANIVEYICKKAEKHDIYLTEFEILTISAFKYFADKKVDIAVIETGLGGRFDATNVCKKPLCSVITSISLDHTDRLGNTIEKIAFEKAGIIKQNSCVIISKSNKGRSVIMNFAEKVNANVICIEDNVNIKYENNINYALIEGIKYEFPLLGTYQKQNLALVCAVVKYLMKNGYEIKLKEGLKTVKWEARLEYIKDKNILIDGAHNPSGVHELRKSIDYYFKSQKKIYIYATINTKDYKSIAKILFNNDDEIYYYEFNHKNAVTFNEYKANVTFLKNLNLFSSDILKKDNLKIITGSLYMIGEFKKNFVL